MQVQDIRDSTPDLATLICYKKRLQLSKYGIKIVTSTWNWQIGPFY